MSPHDTVILAARRTPIGAFQGALSHLSATELGAHAIRAAWQDSAAPASAIDEVYMGCCLMAGLGQAPARQALLKAGLPDSVPATTLTKMCGSGMKAVMLAHDQLQLGQAQALIAGGMESMSRAPHLMPFGRTGLRMGAGTVLDHMLHDGLQDAYDGQSMGLHADRVAEEQGIGRAEQDAYALESVRRAQHAVRTGLFANEVAPWRHEASAATTQRQSPAPVTEDETPGTCQPDKITRLQPVFRPQGSITAASSASISDGASALVLGRADVAHAQGWPVLARLVGHSTHAAQPSQFATAPVEAMRKLLSRIGWRVSEVDLFEVNEAFAVVPLIAMRELGLPHDKVNVHGGACALGHPIGATGARIVITLLHALRQRGQRKGVACLCIGGGEATAVAIELL